MDRKKVALELVRVAKVLIADSAKTKVAASGKYPELDKIAHKLSQDFAKIINKDTANVKSEMPYKAQYVLEEVIKKLQEMV